MKRRLAAALGLWIAFAPISNAAETAGSIRGAAVREARRLILTAQDTEQDRQWAVIRTLRPGTPIVIATDVFTNARVLFSNADASTLTIRLSQSGSEQTIARAAIREIDVITTTSSVHGPVIGAVGGFLAGMYAFAGIALSDKPCGDCTVEKVGAWSLLLGLPIGGAVLGYQATRRTTQKVLYRAP